MVEFAAQFEGVMGARMMGGGFGGSTLHLLKEDAVQDYQHALSMAYFKRFGKEAKYLKQNWRTASGGIH
ncbi:MAG: hypothetical protein IPN15_16630 [Saprospiraceae bacterium]|nr:hypothetical protein [Candidatus Vicinibacter affinis]